MWLNPYPSLLRAKHASFAVPGDLSAAVERLRAQVTRFAFQTPFRDAWVGSVSDSRVCISRYQAWHRGGPNVVLDARFDRREGTRLVGVFRKPQFERFFLIGTAGLIIASIPLGLFRAMFVPWESRWDHLMGVGVSLVLLVILRAGLEWQDQSWDKDCALLEHFVLDTVAEPPR